MSRSALLKRATTAEKGLNFLLTGLTNYQNESAEGVLSEHIKLIKALVDDSDPRILCHSALTNSALYTIMLRTCTTGYNARRYAQDRGYDVDAYLQRRDWKRDRQLSMLVAHLIRLRSAHNVPPEISVLAIAMKRAGASKRVKSWLRGLALTVCDQKVDTIVSYFLKNPFKMPEYGRIGLGVYDNCTYTRKFAVIERAGDHEKVRIDTVNSLEIPIGAECALVTTETPVWNNGRPDLFRDFDPNGQLTRNTMTSCWNIEFPVLSKSVEPKDTFCWDYPMSDQGNAYPTVPYASADPAKPLRAEKTLLTHLVMCAFQMVRCRPSTLCILPCLTSARAHTRTIKTYCGILRVTWRGGTLFRRIHL
jgi:hypothetical protein